MRWLVAPLFLGACGSAAVVVEPTPPTELEAEAEAEVAEPVTLTNPRPTQPTQTRLFTGIRVAEVFDRLDQRMSTIGETTADLAEWDAMMEEGALYIASRLEDPTKLPELMEFRNGYTPILYASQRGYHRVLEVLLQFDLVREHLNDPDSNGVTPWQHTNIGESLTFSAMFGLDSDPLSLDVVRAMAPYYADLEFSPYHRTRALLEAAGAEQDIEGVRELLLSYSMSPDDVEAALRTSDDILTTLRDFVIAGGRYAL